MALPELHPERVGGRVRTTRILPFFLLVGLITSCLVVLFHKKRLQTYTDRLVTAGEARTWFNCISPHASVQNYVKIGNSLYEPVRGSKPYYVHIPEINSILLVTDSHGKTTFHIINIDTKKEAAIDASRSDFGYNITSIRPPGSDLTDYVESATSDKLLLASRYSPRTIYTTVNLASSRIESIREVVDGRR